MKELPVICAAVIKDNNGKILLGKRRKNPLFGYWAFPGGHIKFGEKIEQTLRREINEETGLRLKKFKFKTFTELYFPKNKFHRIILFFDVKVKNGKLRAKSDLGNLKWFTKKETKKLKMFKWDKKVL